VNVLWKKNANKLINFGRKDCTIPSMTAGNYVISATGTSVAIGKSPRQQITIIVNGRVCAQKINTRAWSENSNTIRAVCEVMILSGSPVLVSAVYADVQALKEARGPELSIERQQWAGVLNMRDATVGGL
jgi:hypothetical protein